MRYLGNKTRLLRHIRDFIENQGIEGEVFCDLFSGSASVCDYFKSQYKILANDFLYSSYVITRAKIENSATPAFAAFVERFHCSPFVYFSDREYAYEENHFICNEYSPRGGRGFFTEETANKIDGIRIEIEQLRDEGIFNENEYVFMLASLLESVMGVSNTTGTYEAFLKDWDSRALKRFVLTPLTMEETPLYSQENITYCEDSNDLLRKIEGDILYLDTPYTVTEYSAAYHILETIAKYDDPAIKGLTGRRTENVQKSPYCKKEQALAAYEDLIRQAKFDHIIISYSNQALVPLDELIGVLSKYAVNRIVSVERIPYREYKNIRSSQKGPTLFEVLIYVHKDRTVLKSPLNYTGSKNYIVDKIIENLPRKISSFVDAMGGAFNVGVNIVADKEVVYNEYNPYVYKIIELILAYDKDELVAEIRQFVYQFGLEKCNKENYIAFRDYYNKNQSPLLLFILQMFCFQNQMRFNSKHEFNTPIGNCGCNETTFERIRAFKPKTETCRLLNLSYKDLNLKEFDKDAVFYFDPPYFITSATYNDGKRGFNGWDKEQEAELLQYLSMLNEKGYKFMLSNVIYHKGRTNEILLNWINENNFTVVEIGGSTRSEVIIRNY